ncbi:MAG: hypothetical protein AAF889_10950, partial [Cyanobacteria bacterium P01_D01_bin.73]
ESPSAYIKLVGWTTEEIQSLFKEPVNDAIEEVKSRVQEGIMSHEGDLFQQIMMFDMWERQHRYISYQHIMYDYYIGSHTPFLNRAYGKFCFALPRVSLDHRWILREVYRRYYRNVSVINVEPGEMPMSPTTSYGIKRKLAKVLPNRMRVGKFREFSRPRKENWTSRALQASGKRSLWPFPEAMDALEEHFNREPMEKLYQQSLSGNASAYKKLSDLFPVAIHFLNR